MPGVQTYPSVDEIDRRERDLRNQVAQRAVRQLSEIEGTNDVHVRDILPADDLDQDDSNNDNSWNGTNREWIQSGMSADQFNQTYEVDASNKGEDKVIGIFAFSNVSGAPLTTAIQFEDGTGSIFERAQVQEVFARSDDTVALLEEPIIINTTEDVTIKQWCNNAGTDKVVFHGAVAEKKGNTLGARQTATGRPTPGR